MILGRGVGGFGVCSGRKTHHRFALNRNRDLIGVKRTWVGSCAEMKLQRVLAVTWTLAALFSLPGCSTVGEAPDAFQTASILPDISGLAWIGGDLFLAVHDAKNPEEDDRPRVSLVELPKSPTGLTRQTMELTWPEPQGLSSDLESVARIPGTALMLLVESGEAK
jgi:hypothetical protein